MKVKTTILEPSRASKRIASSERVSATTPARTVVHSSVSKRVIGLPFVVVTQNLVGFCCLLEFLFRLWIVFVSVWMVLLGKLEVILLDV